MLVNDTNLPKVIIVLTSPRGKGKKERDKRKETKKKKKNTHIGRLVVQCCCALFLPTKNIAALRQSDRHTVPTCCSRLF